jgi:hypothetical protein
MSVQVCWIWKCWAWKLSQVIPSLGGQAGLSLNLSESTWINAKCYLDSIFRPDSSWQDHPIYLVNRDLMDAWNMWRHFLLLLSHWTPESASKEAGMSTVGTNLGVEAKSIFSWVTCLFALCLVVSVIKGNMKMNFIYFLLNFSMKFWHSNFFEIGDRWFIYSCIDNTI